MKATKIIKELRPINYEEKLREHGLFNLVKRRLGGRRGDLITFHIYKEVIQKMDPRL